MADRQANLTTFDRKRYALAPGGLLEPEHEQRKEKIMTRRGLRGMGGVYQRGRIWWIYYSVARTKASNIWKRVVPGEGVEPSWTEVRGILSPVRLPVSPPRRHVLLPYLGKSVERLTGETADRNP